MNDADFDVIWDGSHHGQDLDLLNVDARVPLKRQAGPGGTFARRQNQARDVILGVLRTGARLTQNDLCERTGLPMGTVNSVVYDLRLKGWLAFRDAGRVSPMGRALREYWLVGEAEARAEKPAPIL